MLKSESYKRGLFFSGSLNVIAKGIVFLNSLILAFYFGSGASTDIYFYILSVALLVTNTVNGIDFLVLVPQAIKIRQTEGEFKSQIFFNYFVWLYVAIGTLITIVIIVSPIFFFTLFSKFDVHQLSSNKHLLYIGSVIIFFQLLNNLLNAILVSYKYFTIPIITNLINSLFAIVLTLIFHKQLGITGTILGISLGYVLNFILLIWLLKKKQHWHFFKVVWMKSKVVWRNIGLTQLNILPVWIRMYITLYLLTGLGSGVLTSVNFGQMLATMPEIFILVQVASIVGIKFSELAAANDFVETTKLLKNLFNSLVLMILPIALVFAICNKEIISIVLQRGQFNTAAVNTTGFCFFCFALLLPSRIYDVFFTRLFTSFQVYGLTTILAMTAHFLIAALTYIGIKQYQLNGYFISQLIGYYLIMPLIFYIVLIKRFKGVGLSQIIKNFFFTVLVFPLLYFSGHAIAQLLDINIFIKIIIIGLFTSSVTFLLAYYLLDLSYFCQTIKTTAKKIIKKKGNDTSY